ncbi:MAG TPA: hypothetical protein VGW75_11590 [Solirubrobacteraceae bacterium]|jgi:cytochrome P450|nr:hypothetical protein [Solirubrobacteraceae bacterium]
MRATSRAEIERILSDPSYEVPGVPEAPAGLGWLRATASRFVDGERHARRRALVEAELAALDPDALRSDARARTEAALSEAGERVDVMAAVARSVPLATLAAALGIGDAELGPAVADARLAGGAYLTGEGDAAVDAAVERLRAALPRSGPEASAAAIAVLAQACEATAALIGNAFALAAREGGRADDVDGLLAQTLRRSSPIRVMKRVSPAGETVVLDLDAAGRASRAQDRPLAFGSGARPCPGEEQARAIAAGVLEPLLRRCEPAGGAVPFDDDPAVRRPARLEAVVR